MLGNWKKYVYIYIACISYGVNLFDEDATWHGAEVSDQFYASAALTPGKQVPFSIDYEAERAAECVWLFWRGEKFLTPATNKTPIGCLFSS